ncbi:MAG: hypothetical protein Q9168_002991 [Polycauliona sp. 1 TL-2023]
MVGAPRGHDVVQSLIAKAIEVNLRSPSMLHGKKGFERVVWAFQNVLDSAVTWLFYDFESKKDKYNTTRKSPLPVSEGASVPWAYLFVTELSPLAKHHPRAEKCDPVATFTAPIMVPELISGSAPWPRGLPEDFSVLEDRVVAMDEWLSLVMLQSPRIRQDDDIDPYLSRYHKPIEPDASASEVRSLVCLRWHGFIPGAWLRQLFVILREPQSSQAASTDNLRSSGCLLNSSPSPPWFSLSCHAFQADIVDCTSGYAILALSGQVNSEQANMVENQDNLMESSTPSADSYVLWEYSQA